MKKFITIGDTHGRNDWKTIDPTQYDQIIFVGDYMDSFDKSNYEIFINLTEIIEFKQKYPEKVILLFGNHDLWYYFGGSQDHYCSGVRPTMLWDISDLMRSNRRLFQAAYQYDNYIWTHAGIHLGWYKNFIKTKIEEDDVDLADTLNRLFEQNYKPLFNVSFYRGGTSKEGGIFWADRNETWDKPLPGYHQIVGHTPVDVISTRVRPYKNKEVGKITYVDCLGSELKSKFFELTIEERTQVDDILDVVKKYEELGTLPESFLNELKQIKNF